MKLTIDHIYGNMSNFDLQIPRLKLDLEDSKEIEALENGWLIYNNEWYQSRSVRIDVDKYTKVPKKIKDHEVYFECLVDIKEIDRVFETFLNKKKLKSLYELHIDKERTVWLLVRKNGILVAFTKFINYENGIESQYTAWDYEEPKLSIGTKIVDYEVEFVKSKGLKYLYIGSGYGEVSKYKAKFEGFEWWTGTEWSTDKYKYLELCDRDEKIKTLEDLSKIYVT